MALQRDPGVGRRIGSPNPKRPSWRVLELSRDSGADFRHGVARRRPIAKLLQLGNRVEAWISNRAVVEPVNGRTRKPRAGGDLTDGQTETEQLGDQDGSG